jgi:adenylylsulfate kinase-like enzyme
MIVVLFGQPSSGKTFYARKIQKEYLSIKESYIPIIDGNEIRDCFKNYDYSKAGRYSNATQVNTIATYMHSRFNHVIVASIYPYNVMRRQLESWMGADSVIWICLNYVGQREKSKYKVEDFQLFTDMAINFVRTDLGDETETFNTIKEIISQIFV